MTEDIKSWIYAGGLPYELTEGDIICVFSQYGEILEISLSRDKDTGKSRGFCFIKYEDTRSSELAVDNLNAASILGRKIKVSYSTNSNAIKSKRSAIEKSPEPKRLTAGSPRNSPDSQSRDHRRINDDQHYSRSEDVRRGNHSRDDRNHRRSRDEGRSYRSPSSEARPDRSSGRQPVRRLSRDRDHRRSRDDRHDRNHRHSRSDRRHSSEDRDRSESRDDKRNLDDRRSKRQHRDRSRSKDRSRRDRSRSKDRSHRDRSRSKDRSRRDRSRSKDRSHRHHRDDRRHRHRRDDRS